MKQLKKIHIKSLQWGIQIALCVGIFFFAGSSQTQEPSLPTRHVHAEVISGEAALVSPMDVDQVMHLDMVMPLRNETQLDQLLEDIYNPASPNYGKYLTVKEFTEKFGPTPQDFDAAKNFVKSNGMTITNEAPNRLVLSFDGRVGDIQKAFNVNMNVYRLPGQPRTFFSPDSEPMIVDSRVKAHHIAGLDNMYPPHANFHIAPHSPLTPVSNADNAATATDAKANASKTANAIATGSGPSGTFLGSDMRKAYYGGTALTGAGQTVAVMEFAGFEGSDVENYFSSTGQTLKVPVTSESVDGSSVGCPPSSCDDTEQALDIEQIISMAPGLKGVISYVSDSSDVKIFNAMATELKAHVISNSWGWSPADPASDEPIFKEFKAQGQTLLVASGDAGSYNTEAALKDGVYPAEDAYVTSVGATDLTTTSSGAWASETAWENSGGGHSPDKLAIPDYQTAKGVITTTNNGSTTLRNVPDVSAEGNEDNYVCADGQCGSNAIVAGGTSFAAPRWAGFLALANQQAIANGNPRVGHVNAALYKLITTSNDTNFHDVTSGSNGKYKAVTGYDLVTGLGSPTPQLITTLAR